MRLSERPWGLHPVPQPVESSPGLRETRFPLAGDQSASRHARAGPRLTETVLALPEVDEARIGRIAAQLARGTYHVDPLEVADKALELLDRTRQQVASHPDHAAQAQANLHPHVVADLL